MFTYRNPRRLSAPGRQLRYATATMHNHGFDETPHEMHTGPVSTMDDDVPLTVEMCELLCEIVLKVAFSNGRSAC